MHVQAESVLHPTVDVLAMTTVLTVKRTTL